jgi:hypothetical protein
VRGLLLVFVTVVWSGFVTVTDRGGLWVLVLVMVVNGTEIMGVITVVTDWVGVTWDDVGGVKILVSCIAVFKLRLVDISISFISSKSD